MFVFLLTTSASYAENEELLTRAQELFNATQIVCSGISDEISDVFNVSKINTVVTGAGTVAAGGALVAGLSKSQEEEEIDRLVEEICKQGGCTAEGVESMSDENFWNNVMSPMAEIAKLMELKGNIDKSKRLGNWRTGLMAGTIGTNLASAIMSGLNANQSDLIQHIQACNEMLDSVKVALIDLKAAGVNPHENMLMRDMDHVAIWCDKIDISDVEKIEKRMKGVLGTAVAGTVVGVAGTATSAAANSDKYTDAKNRVNLTQDEKDKKDSLNTVSNILAGANVVTGAVETGLNISLITLTKRLMQQAERCEEVLK